MGIVAQSEPGGNVPSTEIITRQRDDERFAAVSRSQNQGCPTCRRAAGLSTVGEGGTTIFCEQHAGVLLCPLCELEKARPFSESIRRRARARHCPRHTAKLFAYVYLMEPPAESLALDLADAEAAQQIARGLLLIADRDDWQAPEWRAAAVYLAELTGSNAELRAEPALQLAFKLCLAKAHMSEGEARR